MGTHAHAISCKILYGFSLQMGSIFIIQTPWDSVESMEFSYVFTHVA